MNKKLPVQNKLIDRKFKKQEMLQHQQRVKHAVSITDTNTTSNQIQSLKIKNYCNYKIASKRLINRKQQERQLFIENQNLFKKLRDVRSNYQHKEMAKKFRIHSYFCRQLQQFKNNSLQICKQKKKQLINQTCKYKIIKNTGNQFNINKFNILAKGIKQCEGQVYDVIIYRDHEQIKIKGFSRNNNKIILNLDIEQKKVEDVLKKQCNKNYHKLLDLIKIGVKNKQVVQYQRQLKSLQNICRHQQTI